MLCLFVCSALVTEDLWSTALELGVVNIVGHCVDYSRYLGKQVNSLLQFNVLSALMQVDSQGMVGAGGRGPQHSQEVEAPCTSAGVLRKRKGRWRGPSTSFVPCCPPCPFLRQAVLLAMCYCSLVPTLQTWTLRLREVNELAQGHTAKKPSPAEAHLLSKLPRWGGWAKVGWVGRGRAQGKRKEADTPSLAAQKPSPCQASRSRQQLWFTRPGAGLRCFASQMHAGSSGVSLRLYECSSKASLGSMPVAMVTALGG